MENSTTFPDDAVERRKLGIKRYNSSSRPQSNRLFNFHCYRTDGFLYKPRMPDVGFDLETNRMAFRYFSFGAACSEVEIDCLTGDHEVAY